MRMRWQVNVFFQYTVSTRTQGHNRRKHQTESKKQAPVSGDESKQRERRTHHHHTHADHASGVHVVVEVVSTPQLLHVLAEEMQRSRQAAREASGTLGREQHPALQRARRPPQRSAGAARRRALAASVAAFVDTLQDVDRVLVHLSALPRDVYTLLAPSLDRTVSGASRRSRAGSGGSAIVDDAQAGSGPGSGAEGGGSRLRAAHPFFHVLASLSVATWHRWFDVERFELLCGTELMVPLQKTQARVQQVLHVVLLVVIALCLALTFTLSVCLFCFACFACLGACTAGIRKLGHTVPVLNHVCEDTRLARGADSRLEG